jgi:transcriptional regulator NrdR family protein
MLCPNCGYTESHIIRTTRPTSAAIRRRRECERCKARFSTLEVGVTTRAPIDELIIARRFHVLQMLSLVRE